VKALAILFLKNIVTLAGFKGRRNLGTIMKTPSIDRMSFLALNALEEKEEFCI